MNTIDNLAVALVNGHAQTRASALAAFGIANLTAEIATLRTRGYRIKTTTSDDGSGTGRRYTKWSFAGTTRAGSPAEAHVRTLRRTQRTTA